MAKLLLHKSLQSDERGASLVEYALLVSLIAIIAIAAIAYAGRQIRGTLNNTAHNMSGESIVKVGDGDDDLD